MKNKSLCELVPLLQAAKSTGTGVLTYQCFCAYRKSQTNKASLKAILAVRNATEAVTMDICLHTAFNYFKLGNIQCELLAHSTI